METDTSIIAKRAPKRYLFALFMCLLVEWSFTDYVQDKGHPRECQMNCVMANFILKTHRSGSGQRQGAGPPVPTSVKITTIGTVHQI